MTWSRGYREVSCKVGDTGVIWYKFSICPCMCSITWQTSKCLLAILSIYLPFINLGCVPEYHEVLQCTKMAQSVLKTGYFGTLFIELLPWLFMKMPMDLMIMPRVPNYPGVPYFTTVLQTVIYYSTIHNSAGAHRFRLKNRNLSQIKSVAHMTILSGVTVTVF